MAFVDANLASALLASSLNLPSPNSIQEQIVVIGSEYDQIPNSGWKSWLVVANFEDPNMWLLASTLQYLLPNSDPNFSHMLDPSNPYPLACYEANTEQNGCYIRLALDPGV